MKVEIEIRQAQRTYLIPSISVLCGEELRGVSEELKRQGYRHTKDYESPPETSKLINDGKEVVLVRYRSVCPGRKSEVTEVYVRDPRPLTSFVAHHFEEQIAKLFGNSGGPGPWEPSREDEVRTFLVGGSGAIAARETASREWLQTGFTVRACEKALSVARKAEQLGVSLHAGYTVADLQKKLHSLEEAERAALKQFEDEDNRLCISNYNAWRIANK